MFLVRAGVGRSFTLVGRHDDGLGCERDRAKSCSRKRDYLKSGPTTPR
jgi:hypothetical protein